MLIGEHIRALREAKKLSQGDIETRTGLRRSYLSRVRTAFSAFQANNQRNFDRGQVARRPCTDCRE